MNRSRLLVLSLVSLLTGCASGSAPLRLRASDPASFAAARPDQPLIVEFQEGDVIPLRVTVRGELAETDASLPPVAVRARRHFFLRIDGDRLAVSLDGEHFGSDKKGSLAFGIGFGPDGGKASLAITTPVPAR